MRARFIILACMALAVSPCLATDPPAPKPVVILPVAPAPTPVPNPMPGPPQTVTKLEKGARYVVRASKQCDMVISPEGLVEVEEKKGPRDWTAIFAGGTGDYEDRHYDDPFLYSVKAVGTGTVKITFIPRGYTTRAEWVEATIEANNGPRPPDPKPPEPKPPEPVGPTAKRLAIVVIEESGQRTTVQGKVMFDTATRDWLKTGKHEIDILDQNDAAAKANGYLPYAQKVGLPAVLVFDADATGPQTPLKQFKLPVSGAAFKTELEGAVKK